MGSDDCGLGGREFRESCCGKLTSKFGKRLAFSRRQSTRISWERRAFRCVRVGVQSVAPLFGVALREGRPIERRTTSSTSSMDFSASPFSAASFMQPRMWSSRIRRPSASTAARSAAVCCRMSTQYSSRSTMRAIPRTCPSSRRNRLSRILRSFV
jgi:hypothetical protein